MTGVNSEVKKLSESFVAANHTNGYPSEPEHSHYQSKKNLSDEISQLTFQSVYLCYQCGKCSAGCPVRDYMDISPNRVVRIVQLGFDDAALGSSTPWLCAGCLACTTRCPNNFDMAKFMDAMRELSVKKGKADTEKSIQSFHKAFLDQIKLFGRSYEMGLVADFKLRTLHALQDVDSAPAMFAKGKLKLIPHRIKDTKVMKKIFRNSSGSKRKGRES